MKALVWIDKNTVKMEERPIPECGINQILIKVAYTGICGTDMAIFQKKHPRATAPLIMGHEFSGVVTEVGEKVTTGFTIGDRVSADPLISCHQCSACLNGNMHVCKTLHMYGADCDGSMAEYIAVNADMVFKLPDDISMKEAAVCEPAAVIIHALRQIKMNYFSTVCVTGLGPIGLLMALAVRECGVKKLICVEANPHRVEYARKLGLNVVSPLEEDVKTAILKVTGQEGVNVLIEASGSPKIAEIMCDLTAVKGEILMLSVFKELTAIDLRAINFKEQTLIGTRVYTKLDYIDAIKYVATHKEQINMILSHTYTLEKGQEVFMDLISGKSTEMKVLLAIDKEL